MKLLKELKSNKQTIIKTILYFLILIIILYIGVIVYSLIFEKDKITIDNYNFSQLEKAKKILDNISKNAGNFYTLEEFNDRYKADIKPIKNCYFIMNHNGKYPYVFGFQLESMMYKFIYFGKNYAYPTYDLPYDRVCFGVVIHGESGGCYYSNGYDGFIKTISNPCQD